MRRSISTIAFAFLVCAPLVAQTQSTVAPSAAAAPAAKKVSAAKEQAIRELLAITGMEKLLDQMVGQMMGGFEKELPSVPPEVWHRMAKKMNARPSSARSAS